MCLSIPGKVISIEKNKIIIDYSGEKREAVMSVVNIKKGDYVIVSNKVIVSKLSRKDAEKTLKLLKK